MLDLALRRILAPLLTLPVKLLSLQRVRGVRGVRGGGEEGEGGVRDGCRAECERACVTSASVRIPFMRYICSCSMRFRRRCSLIRP